MTSDFEKYQTEFADAKLPIAPIPQVLRPALHRVSDLNYSTRSQQAARGSLQVLEDLQAGTLEDYALIAFGGHGMNSYQIYYQFFYKRLLMLMERHIGGAYSDQENNINQVQMLFDRIENLLTVLDEAQHAGRLKPQEHIIVSYGLDRQAWHRFDRAEGASDLLKQDWQESSDPIQDALTVLAGSA